MYFFIPITTNTSLSLLPTELIGRIEWRKKKKFSNILWGSIPTQRHTSLVPMGCESHSGSSFHERIANLLKIIRAQKVDSNHWDWI